MNHCSHFFSESQGITLPDGTVFGNGFREVVRVVDGSDRPGMFRVYEVFGSHLVEKESGRYYGWREMHKMVIDLLQYQISIGNTVWQADNCEWDRVTWKKQITDPESI